MFSWSFLPSRCLKSGELNGKIYHLYRVIKSIVIGGHWLVCDQRFVVLNAAQMRPTWMGHLRLRGNRSVCREGIKPICLTIHKVLALTSGSTQHVQYVELCCIYWIFIHIPVRWVMCTTDIFDDIMVGLRILSIAIVLNDLNPFRFVTGAEFSQVFFFSKCWEWNDPLEFSKCNERLNTGRPAGARPCGGGKEKAWGQDNRSGSCCGRTGPSAEGSGWDSTQNHTIPSEPTPQQDGSKFIWMKMLNSNVRESQGIYTECHCGRVVSSWRSCGPFCCSWDWCGCGGSTLCTASTNVRTRHRKCLHPHLYS